jgi:hypothetical protein
LTFPKAAFIKLLPGGASDTTYAKITALASFRTERFVPANTATTFTLANQAIPDHTRIYKNGTRMDDGAGTPAYSIAGKVVTLNVAANGSDVFLVDYHFRVS